MPWQDRRPQQIARPGLPHHVWSPSAKQRSGSIPNQLRLLALALALLRQMLIQPVSELPRGLLRVPCLTPNISALLPNYSPTKHTSAAAAAALLASTLPPAEDEGEAEAKVRPCPRIFEFCVAACGTGAVAGAAAGADPRTRPGVKFLEGLPQRLPILFVGWWSVGGCWGRRRKFEGGEAGKVNMGARGWWLVAWERMVWLVRARGGGALTATTCG